MKLKLDNIFLYCIGTYIVSYLFDIKKKRNNNTTSNFLHEKNQINEEYDFEDELVLSDYEYFDNYNFYYILKDSEYYLYFNEYLICKISSESPYKLKINTRRFNKTFILKHENISDKETKFILNCDLDFFERVFFRAGNININFQLVKDNDTDIKLIIENNKGIHLLLDRFNNMENLKEYLNYKNFIIEFNEK